MIAIDYGHFRNILSISKNSDFWKGNQHQFPELAKLACRYLQVPASSALVERLFQLLARSSGQMVAPSKILK